jgi:hypothetical protein
VLPDGRNRALSPKDKKPQGRSARAGNSTGFPARRTKLCFFSRALCREKKRIPGVIPIQNILSSLRRIFSPLQGLASLGEAKSLRDRAIQMNLKRAPLCRSPLEIALLFLRCGSWPGAKNLSPLWTK